MDPSAGSDGPVDRPWLKFELTERFRGDLKRLSSSDYAIVRAKLTDFVAAWDRYVGDPSSKWSASLRVKPVEAAPEVFEVIFSVAGPDIRATFEWISIEGELAVRWRGIGGHGIFELTSQPMKEYGRDVHYEAYGNEVVAIGR